MIDKTRSRKGKAMNNYVIITDSGTDFTNEMAVECDVKVIDLMVSVEGQEPIANSEIDAKELYAMLREKKGISTSAINLETAKEEMEKHLKEGKDVIYLGFSSGLSSTFHAGSLAADELREEYPDRRIYTKRDQKYLQGYHIGKLHL